MKGEESCATAQRLSSQCAFDVVHAGTLAGMREFGGDELELTGAIGLAQEKAPGETGRKFVLGRRSAVPHHSLDGHYACRAEQELGGEGSFG